MLECKIVEQINSNHNGLIHLFIGIHFGCKKECQGVSRTTQKWMRSTNLHSLRSEIEAKTVYSLYIIRIVEYNDSYVLLTD